MNNMENQKVHPLKWAGELPSRFNCPFCYTPHESCVLATREVQAYLEKRTDWESELRKGKMFGVLVVKDAEENLGFLAAFSGILAGSNVHDWFVPPVYDVQTPDGYFRKEEQNISDISHRIGALERSPDYVAAQERYARVVQTADTELTALRHDMKVAKQRRDQLRAEGMTDEAELIRQSQFIKAEYRRRRQALADVTAASGRDVRAFQDRIEGMRQERKRRSAALQTWLFAQFRMLNAHGEVRDLNDIFRDTPMGVPPAGAGECAAPKLLQYAFLHDLAPVQMAEFWWGDSPAAEVRHHGSYYPSCRGKCGPILGHMLQGMDVDANPLEDRRMGLEVKVIYEDDAVMVVDKPSGLLSVPGKYVTDSVESRMRRHCGDIAGPMAVHRLDQDTSGLLVLAKNKAAHQNLQEQFHRHEVHKVYQAWLAGDVAQDEGVIDLPLRPDPLDRPRQMVDVEHGKPAVTRFRVLRRERFGESVHTLMEFRPETGRTHQLRVHSAHPSGLGHPIVGDSLYGAEVPDPSQRLRLHAVSIEFRHPVTGRMCAFTSPTDAGIPDQDKK